MNYMPSPTRGRRYTPRPRVQNADPAIVQAWKDAHPDETEWLRAQQARDNDFACSLIGSINRYGRLTDKQLACVRNNILRDANAPQIEAERIAAAPEVSVLAIETAFSRANEAGVKYPKLTFAVFTFSPAPKSGRNPGAVYVKDKDDGTYYGMAKAGKFLKSRDCPEDAVLAILRTCADPHAEAIAYGKEFGVCCCCNRTLTDPKSVAKGIGPVCEKTFGWGV